MPDSNGAQHDGDPTAIDRLLAGLAETPAPSGESPLQISKRAQRAGGEEQKCTP